MKLPEAKARDQMAWYNELAEAASKSAAARAELKDIRTVMNSDSTYTTDNRRFCAQRASMLHKQRTGLEVTDETMRDECFMWWRTMSSRSRKIINASRSQPVQDKRSQPPSTNFDVING